MNWLWFMAGQLLGLAIAIGVLALVTYLKERYGKGPLL